MNSTSSANDQSKIKTYSTLLSSSLIEMRKLISNADLPQILDRERSNAIQSTMDAQAEEIQNLQQENQILLSQQSNQQDQERLQDERNQFLSIFVSKTKTFFEHFTDFVKVFEDSEDAKINQISQTINKYKTQIQQLSNIVQKYPSNTDLQAKTNEVIQLQKDINELMAQNEALTSYNSQITKSNIDLKNLLQNTEDNNIINTNLINELKKQIDAKNEIINSLQQQNKEKDERITALQNHSNLPSLNTDNEYSESFNFTIQDNNSVITDTNSLKTIESLTKKIDQIQTSLSEKDVQIGRLNQKLNEFDTEKGDLLLQIQQKDIEINRLKSNYIDNKSIDLLKQKIEDMERENQNKNNEINSLKRQISISSSSYKDDQIQSLSSHIVSLSDENSKLNEKIQNIQNSNQQYLDQIKTLQDSKSILTNSNLDLNARIDDLETKLSQLQNSIPPPSNEIQELKELLEKTKKQDNEKIDALLRQVKDTLEHSERVKNELILVQQENAKLQNQIFTLETNMKSIQFNNSLLEKKLKQSEDSNNQKEIMINQLNDSNGELTHRYDELIESHVTLKKQFDQSNKNFAMILGCRPDQKEISKQLTASIEKLSDLQLSVVTNNDVKKEITLLRRQNDDLNNQLKKKDEMLQSTLEKINLCRDGKESEIVKKFNEDFTELNQEHSKLIEEHKQLQRQLFLSESSAKEIESKLIDQQKLNEEMLKKSERLESYEFISSHFIDFLSSLSSALIPSMIQLSSMHKKRQSSVDDLLIQLKKKHFSSEKAIASWNLFCSVVQESLVFDPIENVKSNADRIQYIFNSKMSNICKNMASNQQKINQITNKLALLKTNGIKNNAYNKPSKSPLASSKVPDFSYYQKSAKKPLELSGSPDQSNLSFNRLTPNTITRTNPLARDSPSSVFPSNLNNDLP